MAMKGRGMESRKKACAMAIAMTALDWALVGLDVAFAVVSGNDGSAVRCAMFAAMAALQAALGAYWIWNLIEAMGDD